MGIKAADNVAAAMKINDRRHTRCLLTGPVKPQANVPAGARDQALLDLADRKRFGFACARCRFHLLTRLGGSHLLERPQPRFGHHSEDFSYLRMN